MQQTTIEFLIDELKNNEFLGTFCTPDCFAEKQAEMKSIIDKAKEMEKQQAFDFWQGGIKCTEEGGKSFEQYYNQTYPNATNQ